MIAEWIDRFAEIATTWIGLVMLAAWRALPILVLAIGIGMAFRRKLTPSRHALLLTIVVVRLLIPVSIGSSASLHMPIDKWIASLSEESEKPRPLIAAYDPKNATSTKAGRIVAREALVQSPMPSSPSQFYAPEEIICLAVLLIVITVSIGLLFRGVVSHVRFAHRLRACRLLDEPSLIDLVLRECDSLAVGRRPALREVSSLSVPAVFGLFRQTICLPIGLTETMSEEELRWVLRHEIAHIRRRDIPVVMIASIATAFHWFNPMVWIVVNRLRAAMEAAADRLAVGSLTPSEVSAYGNLLIRFAQENVAAKKSPTLGLISFAAGRNLKQRVAILTQDNRPSGQAIRFLTGGLVAIVVVVGLTDAKEAAEAMPELRVLTANAVSPQESALWNDPFLVRESDGPAILEKYEIKSIFDTMPKRLTNSDRSALQQLNAWLPLSPSLEGKLGIDGTMLSAELPARQHRLLKQTLEIWAHGEPNQVSIEARFIQTNIKTASAIDWTKQKIEGLKVRGLGPAIAARVDESTLAKLVRTVTADRKGNILQAPKVTMFDGQTVGIADEVKRPFVTSVDPKADGKMEPVVSLVYEGLRFVLTPRSGADESITLDFEVKTSSIGKISYANLPIGNSDNDSESSRLTVQVPATEQYEISSSVKLAAGESVVVAIPRVFSNEPGADTESTMLVALTPRLIADPESADTLGTFNR